MHPLLTDVEQTLRALDMRAKVGHEKFFEFRHGEGRLKLIERSAAACRAGDLPDSTSSPRSGPGRI